MCPGDVRLIEAPDAPLGAVCSSATHRPAGLLVASAPRTWFPDTETSRCLASQQSFGRNGVGGPHERTVPTIWLCPDIADGDPIVIGGARFGAPAGSHHRVAWPTEANTRSLGRTLSERIQRTPYGRIEPSG